MHNDDKMKQFRAFGKLAVENAIDRAALLAQGYAYDKAVFLEYASRAWELAKSELLNRADHLEVEQFAIGTSDPKTDDVT